MTTAVALLPRSKQPVAWLTRLPRAPQVFAALMTAAAGYLDAIGYVQLSHLYVSFMSGNSTHLGMSIAAGAWSEVVPAAIVIAAFVLGAGLGTIVAEQIPAGQIVAILLAELAVLLVALGLALACGARPALFVVAVAMGMQNGAHQLVSGADVGKSFITGVLFAFGQSLAQVLVGKGCGRRTVVLAASWLSFVFGASIGSLVLVSLGLLTSLALLVGLLALAVLLFIRGVL